MNRFSRIGLRARLLLLVLLALIPASLLMVYTASEQRRLASVAMQENAMRMIRPASAQYEQLVEQTRYLLMLLARLPEVQLKDVAACHNLFASLQKKDPLYANLGLILPNGKLLTSGVAASSPYNLLSRDYFKRAIENQDFSSGTYQIGRITGKPSVSFGYPVIDESGRTIGVLFASLDLKWLDHLAAQLGLPPDSTLTLLDRNGTVLVRYPGPKSWVGHPLPSASHIRQILEEGMGLGEGIGEDGIDRVFAFAPLGGLGRAAEAYLTIGIPKSIAFSHANSLLVRNLVVLWLVGLLTLGAAWLGANWLVLRRVNALVLATNRLSAGDMSFRTGLEKGSDELGTLAGSFDKMAGSLEAAQAQLVKAEEDKKRFYREVIRAVTHGKFHLADHSEIPVEGDLVLTAPLVEASDYPKMRHQLQKIAEAAGMKKEDSEDLALAAGEAATNAIKHATEGACKVYLTRDRIYVRVEDRGKGIRPEDLPATILQPGFSTKVSLGMGYTLMLELVDVVWLSTGPDGTIVQLEQWIHPNLHPEAPIMAAWDRF